MEALNYCDKCGMLENSVDLVWINTEDFEPYDYEKVPDNLHQRYDALCEACYQEEIEILL